MRLQKQLFLLFIVSLVIFYFVSTSSDAFGNKEKTPRCGVGLPSCVGERIRCMNGYCKSDIPLGLPGVSDLPMTPPTRY
jgi:hypothetical protein